MKYYAPFIRKVQIEMGITPTDFDDDLVTDQENYVHETAEVGGIDDNCLEREMDYDSLSEARRKIINGQETVDTPRPIIFDKANRENYRTYITEGINQANKANITS